MTEPMRALLPNQMPKTGDSVLVKDAYVRAGQRGWVFDVYPDEHGCGVHFPKGYGVEFYKFDEVIVCAFVQ